MAPWPFSSTSTTTSSPPTSQPAHAPTGAPIPSPSQTSKSTFTTADPILPPAPPSHPIPSNPASPHRPQSKQQTSHPRLPNPPPPLPNPPPRLPRPRAPPAAKTRSLHLLTSRRVEGENRGEGEKGGVSGLAKRLWMGDEEEGWQGRRMREEREKLARGLGYKDLIGETVEQAFREGTGRGEPDGVLEEEKRRRGRD
ncbi:hypothetical protein G7Y79_00027g060990 [Physcia stellaris]|nr:hypothetical protein G7Y79_00027g060990 [Physcia stellaris]